MIPFFLVIILFFGLTFLNENPGFKVTIASLGLIVSGGVLAKSQLANMNWFTASICILMVVGGLVLIIVSLVHSIANTSYSGSSNYYSAPSKAETEMPNSVPNTTSNPVEHKRPSGGGFSSLIGWLNKEIVETREKINKL